MENSGMVDVAIIGAGITGLTAAYYLKQAGRRVQMLEAGALPGGAIRTIYEEGYLCEAGPNTLTDDRPELMRLIEALGLGNSVERATRVGRNRYILKHGRLHGLQPSPLSLLASGLLTLRGKLRLLREPFVPQCAAGGAEETLDAFVRRRLGSEVADYLMNPFVAGIYAGDPAQLSLQAAFPRLYLWEELAGSLFKGALRARRETHKRTKGPAEIISLKGGLFTLAEALAKQLTPDLITAAQVIGLMPSIEGFILNYRWGGDSHMLQARQVISTVPAYALPEILGEWGKPLEAELNGVAYPPVHVVHVAYPARAVGRPLDGFGFLIPALEQRKFLGGLFSSALFPSHAPKGQALFTLFVGGTRDPDAALAKDLEPVLRDFEAIMQIKSQPVFQRSTLWPRAIPQYTIGHLGRMEKLAAFEQAYPGLHLAGNFRGGISVPDALASAERLAETVKLFAESKPTEQVKEGAVQVDGVE